MQNYLIKERRVQKKKFDLTADLVNISDEAKEYNLNNTKERSSLKDKTVLLTVSVKESFRAELKSWSARHRMNMNEAVVKSFQLMKEKYGP